MELTGRITRNLALWIVIAPLAGCVPAVAPVTRDLETKVIDSATHQPISRVVVTAWADDYPEDKSIGKTDADGLVVVSAVRRTVWLPIVQFDFETPPGRLRFEAPGYQTREIDEEDVTMDSAVELDPLVFELNNP